MCGFIGCLYNERTPESESEELRARTSVITHRGPDDEGYSRDDFIRFGFRRLSIIDVEGGSQPLTYDDGRYVIVFNGEIYNYIELRDQLTEADYTFETTSDTEVILALYKDRKEAAARMLRGMFSFVIWDREEESLFAARDPFGIKPFFYNETEAGLFFASEEKSLLLGENIDTIDQVALQHYFTYQFVPEPRTLSASIKRLAPGHTMTKKPGQAAQIKAYWKPSFSVSDRTFDEKVRGIHDTLEDSVGVHMRSDVPVGAFLSSGIDSTSIVALARQFHPDIQTFTVGFERDGYSEIDVAKDTAQKLDVANHHKVITAEEFLEELPRIVWHMDDPVADPAAIPLYFVAKEASKHVKVVLSGEGADELFGGYGIYREPLALKWFNLFGRGGRRLIKSFAEKLPAGVKGRNYLIRGGTPLEERYVGNAKIFSEKDKQRLLLDYDASADYTGVTRPLYEQVASYPDVMKMQYIDLHTWLRGDILVKADKMTMAHSLELRVPFLDKEVFSAARDLKVAEKTAHGTTKYALRQAVRELVPDSVLHRSKLGFPVPIRHWLRDELYDWARSLIRESGTGDRIHKGEVLRMLEAHRKGEADYSRRIWTVLNWMLWHQIYVEGVYDFSQEPVERQVQYS